MPPRLGHAQGGDHLIGAPGGDAKEVEAIPTLTAPTLAEVEGHGGGSAPELLGEIGIPLGEGGERLAEVTDQLEGDKQARGFRRFSFRGLLAVRAEWAFVCATHNLLKLFRGGFRPLAATAQA